MQQGAESSVRSLLFLGVARPGVRLRERGNGPAVKLAGAEGILSFDGHAACLRIYGNLRQRPWRGYAAQESQPATLDDWAVGSQYGDMHELDSPLHNQQTQVRFPVCMPSMLAVVGACLGGARRDARTVLQRCPACSAAREHRFLSERDSELVCNSYE
jgi:hypothetical protein